MDIIRNGPFYQHVEPRKSTLLLLRCLEASYISVGLSGVSIVHCNNLAISVLSKNNRNINEEIAEGSRLPAC